jgi:hypothetical protein
MAKITQEYNFSEKNSLNFIDKQSLGWLNLINKFNKEQI